MLFLAIVFKAANKRDVCGKKNDHNTDQTYIYWAVLECLIILASVSLTVFLFVPSAVRLRSSSAIPSFCSAIRILRFKSVKKHTLLILVVIFVSTSEVQQFVFPSPSERKRTLTPLEGIGVLVRRYCDDIVFQMPKYKLDVFEPLLGRAPRGSGKTTFLQLMGREMLPILLYSVRIKIEKV